MAAIYVLCPLIGVLSPLLLCDMLRNNSKRKRQLDEYAEVGVEVPGAIMQAETVTRRSYFGCVTRRTHTVVFAYRMQTGDLCVKPETSVPKAPTGRRVCVVVLPGFERSGVLKSVVDSRHGTYRGCEAAMRSILFLVFHAVGIAVLVALVFCSSVTSDECLANTLFWPAVIGTSVLLNVFGYFIADETFVRWKDNLLHGSREIIQGRQGGYSNVLQAEANIPTAEILSVINEDDDPESGQTVQARAIPTQSELTIPVAVVAEASVVKDHHLVWYNPTTDDEKATKVRQAVQEDEWTFLRDLFTELRGKHVERSFYIGVISSALEDQWKANEDEFSSVLDDWAKAEPGNPDCCLVRGNCYIRWAWNARGSGYANTVGEDAWPKFFARVDQAMAELDHTSELDPSDALAYANRVTIFMAKKGRDEVGVRDLVTKLAQSDDPNNLSAHSRLLQFFCAKWGGSEEEMFDFARKATMELSEGDPLWILVVQAHYEVYVGLVSRAQRSQNRIAIAAAVSYWKRPTVKQAVLHSYRVYIGSAQRQPTTTIAEESVLMAARNWYAFCLAQMGHMDMARRELLFIGRHPTERPWGSLDRYQKACNEAGVSL